jgi:hypothetical protein
VKKRSTGSLTLVCMQLPGTGTSSGSTDASALGALPAAMKAASVLKPGAPPHTTAAVPHRPHDGLAPRQVPVSVGYVADCTYTGSIASKRPRLQPAPTVARALMKPWLTRSWHALGMMPCVMRCGRPCWTVLVLVCVVDRVQALPLQERLEAVLSGGPGLGCGGWGGCNPNWGDRR